MFLNLCSDKYCLSLLNYDERVLIVEIKALAEGLCRNDWDFLREGIEECAETFRGQPILCAYKGLSIGDGHNYSAYKDVSSGKMIYDFRAGDAERIVGCIPLDAKIEVKEIDGKLWIAAQGIIWRHYNQQLADDIIRKGFKGVSVEVFTIESTKLESGVENIRKWKALGITVLGDNVMPAVPGAQIKALTATKEYKDFVEKSSIKNNSTNTKGVKKSMDKKEIIKTLCALLKGYIFIALSDDNTHALLLDCNNELKVCNVTELPEKAEDVKFYTPALSANAPLSDGAECTFASVGNAFTALLQRKNDEHEQEIKVKDEMISKLSVENDSLKKSELEHLSAAVVAALEKQYESDKAIFKEEEMIPHDKYEALVKDAKDGKYSSLKDADGKFIGIDVAMQIYLAERSSAIEAFRKSQSEETKKNLSWGFAGNGKSTNTDNVFDYDTLINGLEND